MAHTSFNGAQELELRFYGFRVERISFFQKYESPPVAGDMLSQS